MAAATVLKDRSKAGARYVAHVYNPRTWKEKGLPWLAGLAVVTGVIVACVLAWYWSYEPRLFDVRSVASQEGQSTKPIPGYITTATAVHVAETLLDKRGGYLSNDVMPPSVFLDNVPNWEFGVLVQLRDLSRSMRNYFSRSRTQSVEDRDLMQADPKFHFDSESWIFPTTESMYRDGVKHLRHYMQRLTDEKKKDGEFYARADNLQEHLTIVGQRLGSLAMRLSAAVGQRRLDMDLAGERGSEEAKTGEATRIKTPWLQVDDVFYEARGSTWALAHILKALQYDFAGVLADKNAETILAQLVSELESAQDPLWSPMVLNGGDFSMVANHSLNLSSYVSRANNAVIDLIRVLKEG
ncbi:MAG: DUF2333 family protein [Gammaproteobacteria bacterium]